MNRNRRDLTRRFLPNFFLLPYGTLPNASAPFHFIISLLSAWILLHSVFLPFSVLLVAFILHLFDQSHRTKQILHHFSITL